MANTKTTMISNAIALLGHAPIISLDDGDDMVVAAEQAFDMLLPGVLSENNWRFATQIQQLSMSSETPPAQWKVIYLLPAGYLKNIRIYPQEYDYDIYENSKMYSNYQGTLFMEYIFQPDVSTFPPRFIQYFVYEIAAYLCLSSAQRPDYFNVIEARRVQAFAMAAASEAQNRPNFSQIYFPVLNNRFISGLVGNSFSN